MPILAECFCGQQFTATQAAAKYCSKSCAAKARYLRQFAVQIAVSQTRVPREAWRAYGGVSKEASKVLREMDKADITDDPPQWVIDEVEEAKARAQEIKEQWEVPGLICVDTPVVPGVIQ